MAKAKPIKTFKNIKLPLIHIISSKDDILDSSLYPDDGLYLVDDGIAYTINIVADNTVTNTLYIPRRNIIEPLFTPEDETTIVKSLESKLNATVDNILERFDNTLAVLNDTEVESNPLNIPDLVKIIAVAQDPTLAGEVLG